MQLKQQHLLTTCTCTATPLAYSISESFYILDYGKEMSCPRIIANDQHWASNTEAFTLTMHTKTVSTLAFRREPQTYLQFVSSQPFLQFQDLDIS